MTLRPRFSLDVFTTFCAIILLILLTSTGYASDIAKEKRWAKQLQDQLTVGEPLQLTADQQEFFAIYTPAEGKAQRGGVILLHGLGAHPDWPDVISPLRTGLSESGWATLSIQLPVWPNGVGFEDYPPLFPEANARITAAIQHLQQQGLLNIVLVGQSLGAAMGAYFLAEKATGSDAIRAFVGIGMNQAPGTVAHTPDALAKIKLPVLDLYGALDLPGVLGSAKARASAAHQADNADYQQVVIAGADHFFRSLDAKLIRRVSGWLAKAAPSTELKNGATAKP